MPSLRTTIAALGATVLLGALAGPAAAQEATPSAPDATTSQSVAKKPYKHKNHRHARAHNAAAFAEKLGVTVEELKAARRQVREAVRATEERETRAERKALFAGALGVTVEELDAAYAEVKAERRAQRAERRADRRAAREARREQRRGGQGDAEETPAPEAAPQP